MAWWLNKITAFAAFAGCLAMVETAQAQEPGLLPPDWLTTRVDERGRHCDRRAERGDAKKLLVACGVAGVWEIALDGAGPRFVRSYDFSGDVVGFMTEPDGRLWVKLQVLEARPFTSGGTPPGVAFPDATPAPASLPAAPPAVGAPVPLPAPPPAATGGTNVGRVIRSEPGQVVISLGSLDGVIRGNRIELAVDHTEDSNDDAALSRETLAIGIVTNVTDHSARVRLGLGEDVPVGAVATPHHWTVDQQPVGAAPGESALGSPAIRSAFRGVGRAGRRRVVERERRLPLRAPAPASARRSARDW